MAISYLNHWTQKTRAPAPIYAFTQTGPPTAFASTVTIYIDGVATIFASEGYFCSKQPAKESAARTAVKHVDANASILGPAADNRPAIGSTAIALPSSQDFVSILNLYTQKHKLEMPQYDIKTNMNGTFSAAMELVIGPNRRVVVRASTKQFSAKKDAKSYAAMCALQQLQPEVFGEYVDSSSNEMRSSLSGGEIGMESGGDVEVGGKRKASPAPDRADGKRGGSVCEAAVLAVDMDDGLDPVATLDAWAAGAEESEPMYVLLRTQQRTHRCNMRLQDRHNAYGFSGEGQSADEAKKEAARRALAMLRTLHGCKEETAAAAATHRDVCL